MLLWCRRRCQPDGHCMLTALVPPALPAPVLLLPALQLPPQTDLLQHLRGATIHGMACSLACSLLLQPTAGAQRGARRPGPPQQRRQCPLRLLGQWHLQWHPELLECHQ